MTKDDILKKVLADNNFTGHITLGSKVWNTITSAMQEFADDEVKEPLPKLDKLFEKAKHHTNVVCNLQNFEDEDSILLYQAKYVDGYIQAVKDFVDKNYNPDKI